MFFDRCAIEALAMVHEASPLTDAALRSELGRFAFHRTVFILPPWEAIYTTDAERDHAFAHAVRVHAALVRWYRDCGYVLHDVPCLAPDDRARHVLGALGVRGTAMDNAHGRPVDPGCA